MELECVSCEEGIEVGGGSCSPALEREGEAGSGADWLYRLPPACLSSWFHVLTAVQELISHWPLLWFAVSSRVMVCNNLPHPAGEGSCNVKITLVLSVWAQCFKLCFLLYPSRDSREPFQWQWKFLVLALVLSSPTPDSVGKRQFQPGGHHGIPGYLGLKHKEVPRCQRRC